MAGKFEIFKDKRGEFCFRLKASNGEIILQSESYKAKSGCKNGIASVQKNCTDANCFVTKETKSGQYRFNLRARNNQVIGTSQNYKTEKSRDAGIASVKKHAPKAKIEDLAS